MTLTSIGDLAQTQFLQRRNSMLKNNLQTLGQELATGKASDIAQHLGGSYSRLTSIERDIRVADSFSKSLSEFGQMTSAMQTALEQVRQNAASMSGALITASNGSVSGARSALADQAKQVLANTISTLNQSSAGRNLFAGDVTQGAALANVDNFLTALSTDIAGASGVAAVEAAVDSWFASPTGFASNGYLGSTTAIAPLKLSETAEIGLDIRADNAALKDVIRGLALAAIVEDPGITLTSAEQDEIQSNAGEFLLGAQDDMVVLQAKLGFAEEVIDDWSVRTASARTGLDFARNALLEVDTFEAATRLEAAQFQLESLYSITVRLSQLSLVNYLR